MTRVSIRPSIRNPQRFTDAALDAVDLADARAKWAAVRVAHGFKPTTPNLIPTQTGNAKLQKTAAARGSRTQLSGCEIDNAGARHDHMNL